MNIVPVTKYTTYGYKTDSITSLFTTKLNNLYSHQIQLIDEKTVFDIWHFIENNMLHYKLSVKPSFTMFKNIIN